jgi:hypothetical protein
LLRHALNTRSVAVVPAFPISAGQSPRIIAKQDFDSESANAIISAANAGAVCPVAYIEALCAQSIHRLINVTAPAPAWRDICCSYTH